MRLGHVYYDMGGRELDPANFKRMYPTRVRCDRTVIRGIAIITEFVGINHNPDPDGDPWIYETFFVDRSDNQVFMSCWSYTQTASKITHAKVRLFVALGGGFIYMLLERFTKLWRAL